MCLTRSVQCSSYSEHRPLVLDFSLYAFRNLTIIAVSRFPNPAKEQSDRSEVHFLIRLEYDCAAEQFTCSDFGHWRHSDQAVQDDVKFVDHAQTRFYSRNTLYKFGIRELKRTVLNLLGSRMSRCA